MSESIQGFIVDRTYRVEDGQPKVHLFGRLENGESFQSISDFRPFFYIRTSDRAKAESLATYVHVEDVQMKNFLGEPVTKLTVGEPKIISDIRKILESNAIACYEADLNFAQLFLMAHGVLSKIALEGTFTKAERVNRVYVNPVITPGTKDIPLKVLSFDLEASDANNGLLYSISFACEKTDRTGREEKVFFCSNTQTHTPEQATRVAALKDATVLPDEKSLLEAAVQYILEYDPDILTGWNVIDFDLDFLKKKGDLFQVPFTWGRTSDPNRMRLESTFARDSKAEIVGRQVLDGIQLLKSSFVTLDDYKLGTAAHEILGEEKLIGGANKVEEIIDAYKNNPQHLVDYNLKDSQLVLDIFHKLDLLSLTILRSNLVGLPLERVRASIASLDSLYLRALHERKVVAPSGGFVAKEQGITGGFVMDSKPGIYDWVIVLDFKSLYPSVMRTFNIDPFQHRVDCKARPGEELIHAPNNTCFVNDQGILPALLTQVWEQRDIAKQKKDKTASLAMKILMNSFFGVMASPNCRFFSMELANAITHFAQKYIKRTIAHLEKHDYEVIYGDTDSVFVNAKATSFAQAQAIGNKIQAEMNILLTKEIREDHNRESILELEFEKTYRKFLMPRGRGSDVGSKKRYAGLLMSDDGTSEKMDFTGLEFVRRDWTGLAKEFQLTLLQKVFNEEEVTEYVRQFITDLREGKYDQLLVYRKAIRKDLAAYTKTTPPHVKAARKLIEKIGKLDSSLMSYVMTGNGPEPLGHETSALDYDHYIDKQVRPIADTILCFFDANLDDLMTGDKQKTLFGF